MNKDEKFDHLFNNSGVGIFIVNEDRKILEANNTFCKIFGYSYEEVINKNASFIHLSEESYKNFAKMAFYKVLNNKSLSLDYKFKHKTGKPIWIRISGDSIQLNKMVLWTTTDITKEIEAQERVKYLNEKLTEEIKKQLKILRERDQQLQYQARLAKTGEMLSMIAHQWRQPLTSISAASSYMYAKLEVDEFDKEEFLQELAHIEDYTKYLSKTIDDFRNFFKPNKIHLNTTLESIIEKTLDIVKPTLVNNNIILVEEFTCKEIICTYANEIKQVVLNLLKNSNDILVEKKIKKPIIKLKTYKIDSNAIFEISDNGGGISLDIIDKVFDPYFTTKDDKHGTGLGLSMSKTIIEVNCKGKLSVRNDKKGAVFTISIPL